MSLTQGNDPNAEGERLEEFRSLFADLHYASMIHPARHILEEYVRGVRPRGPNPQAWQNHAISAHVGICHACGHYVEELRQTQQARQARRTFTEAWNQFWRGATHWRRAYQYMGIVLLIGGLIAIYPLLRPPPPPPPPPPVGPGSTIDSPSSGLARLRCEGATTTGGSRPQFVRLHCDKATPIRLH